MFDHVRSRLAYTDNLGLLVVALVLIAALAAVPLSLIDFARPLPPAAFVTAKAAPAHASAPALATTEQPAEPLMLWSLVPPPKTGIPSTGPL